MFNIICENEEYLKSVEYRLKSVPLYPSAKFIAETKYELITKYLPFSCKNGVVVNEKTFDDIRYGYAIPFVTNIDLVIFSTRRYINEYIQGDLNKERIRNKIPMEIIQFLEEEIANFQKKIDTLMKFIPKEDREIMIHFTSRVGSKLKKDERDEKEKEVNLDASC